MIRTSVVFCGLQKINYTELLSTLVGYLIYARIFKLRTVTLI